MNFRVINHPLRSAILEMRLEILDCALKAILILPGSSLNRILQQQLQEEMELHAVLEKAIEKNAMKLSSQSHLPHQAQELLSNIALLEVTVSKLEQDMVSLHFQLSQERNERRLAEYRLRHSSFPSIPRCSSDILNKLISPSLRCSKHSISIVGDAREDNSSQELQDQPLESTDKYEESMIENGVDAVVLYHNKKMSMKIDSKSVQAVEFRKLPKGMPTKGLWDHPNQLSEEMMKCMKNIFISLADSAIPSKSSVSESHCSPLSPRGHLSNLSWWSSSERSMISSWVQSPQVDVKSNSEVLASENACDPYRVRGKLSWADVGNYGLATEVSWMSVGKKQLEYAAGALRRFRTLVEQLAKVNTIHLSCDEKLAFWINLYNALIMHAYLAYGVPRSDLKLFSLMQKDMEIKVLSIIKYKYTAFNLGHEENTPAGSVHREGWRCQISRDSYVKGTLDLEVALFRFG
ncbi:uncharacterized protein LOC115956086 isoform X2 [Quercus lobata]|uniref:uncharacterized protein LOC115956086 isoform X2 n=1 Tax=Quercus lobata TaxID=97700 RepID=UPI001246E10C|nr:uncharacterized protein LOC115956086 isoform X2 [Quercus lobata]XP_030930410.1 uncharacterized protein LOC115956086 isoform X2 [Quercus lobata]